MTHFSLQISEMKKLSLLAVLNHITQCVRWSVLKIMDVKFGIIIRILRNPLAVLSQITYGVKGGQY